MLATSPAIDTQTLVPSIGPSADAAGLQQCSQDQADGDGEDEEDGEFRIEKGPIAGAIHGIPQVLVSGYDIGVSMKVYPKFYKNVGQCATGETRIRAESYGFGTWYILFPPDKIGEVHAGQCAATMNTVRGAPFGDVEVRFLGALGQRIFECSLLEGASASPQPAVFLVAVRINVDLTKNEITDKFTAPGFAICGPTISSSRPSSTFHRQCSQGLLRYGQKRFQYGSCSST